MRNRRNIPSRPRHFRSELLEVLLLTVAVLSAADTAPAQDAAPTPTGLWAAQTTATQITLRWDTVPDATEYRLYQRVSETEIKRIATPARTRNFWVVILPTTSAAGTRLQYQLSAVHPKLGESAIAPFNAVTTIAATPSTPPAPKGVAAALTDSVEVTLRWDAVAGATGYAIGRSITPYGFTTLCMLCPTSTSYVDRAVTRGQGHTYTVEAITPGGRSARAPSNMVPVPLSGASPSSAFGTSLADFIKSLTTARGTALGMPRPPITVLSALKGDGVHLTWQALAADSPTAFVIRRAINLGEFKDLSLVTGDKREYHDRSLPQVYENARMRVAYEVLARNRIGTSHMGVRTQVTVTNPGAPSSSEGFCLIEYRRANTMWAESGKATSAPGLETLRLKPGETRLFKTDWSYENRRNDGRNYYGAHLRQLLNTGPREANIFVRTLDPFVLFYTIDIARARNAVDLARQAIKNTMALTATKRHGFFAALIRVVPGDVIGVRADLLEVACPKI